MLLKSKDSLQNTEVSSCFSMLQNVLTFCLDIGTSTSMAKPNTGMDSILFSCVTYMFLCHTRSDYILSLFFRVATMSKVSPYWLPALMRCIFFKLCVLVYTGLFLTLYFIICFFNVMHSTAVKTLLALCSSQTT